MLKTLRRSELTYVLDLPEIVSPVKKMKRSGLSSVNFEG
jgi:hypothetical protein